MQNDKNDESRIEKSRVLSHPMPTIADITKNINKPISDTDKKEFVSQIVGKISQADSKDFSTDVPSFDLGRQILAQQRKIATLKRKSPNLPDNTQQPLSAKIPSIKTMSQAPASPQQKIISEIIAREIRLLTTAR